MDKICTEKGILFTCLCFIMDDKKQRIVLTGGPCCGKTTTLAELRRREYKVVEEAARAVIEEGIYHPSKSALDFQTAILRRQIALEEQASGTVFLDRSALDGIAYSLLFLNQVPKEFFQHNLHSRYFKVFILDRFPLQKDGARVENSDEEAARIHGAIEGAYLAYGYTPLRVPIMPVEKRVNFILAHSFGGSDGNRS